ncbi:hypothetical protein [Nocardia sp. SSK8]|uniref:hypothetical protein n=1 Tax=Nocardia sp. SSK8 TaxID=3120154 RepID=UPI00300A7BC6
MSFPAQTLLPPYGSLTATDLGSLPDRTEHLHRTTVSVAYADSTTGSGPLLVIIAAFLATVVVWMLIDPTGSAPSGNGLRNTAALLLRRTWAGIAAGIVAAVSAGVYGWHAGWSPENWLAMVSVLAFLGAVTGIVSQLFVIAFGSVAGSITSFGFFMFQLFAFGGACYSGTPRVFRPFESVAPMTYARHAVVRCDSGRYDRMFWISLLVLAMTATLAFAAAILVHRLRRHTAVLRSYAEV